MRTWPTQSEILKTPVFHWYFPHSLAINDASFEAMFPMLRLRWAQLGVKLPMCITWLQFAFHLDRFGPKAENYVFTAISHVFLL
jgi:hypothetical protein